MDMQKEWKGGALVQCSPVERNRTISCDSPHDLSQHINGNRWSVLRKSFGSEVCCFPSTTPNYWSTEPHCETSHRLLPEKSGHFASTEGLKPPSSRAPLPAYFRSAHQQALQEPDNNPNRLDQVCWRRETSKKCRSVSYVSSSSLETALKCASGFFKFCRAFLQYRLQHCQNRRHTPPSSIQLDVPSEVATVLCPTWKYSNPGRTPPTCQWVHHILGQENDHLS